MVRILLLIRVFQIHRISHSPRCRSLLAALAKAPPMRRARELLSSSVVFGDCEITLYYSLFNSTDAIKIRKGGWAC